MKPIKLRVLSDDEILMIHKSTINLLGNIGVKVDSKDACLLLQEGGAHIDDKKEI